MPVSLSHVMGASLLDHCVDDDLGVYRVCTSETLHLPLSARLFKISATESCIASERWCGRKTEVPTHQFSTKPVGHGTRSPNC